MPRKSKTGKTQHDIELEREERFYSALSKMRSGQTKKQAILASGMDPRTFNKLLKEREGNGVSLLTKTYKERVKKVAGKTPSIAVPGRFEVGQSTAILRRWRVLHADETETREIVDLYYSKILGAYWNAIENFISYGITKYLDTLKTDYIFTVTGEKIKLLTDKTKIEFWWRSKSEDAQDTFNEKIYKHVGQDYEDM